MNSAPSYAVHLGKPAPLGATATPHGTNFAIYAREPHDATLLLRAPASSPSPSQSQSQAESQSQSALSFKLRKHHRTGHVWHVEIRPRVTHFRYLWQIGHCDGTWISNACLDPYATLLDTPVGVDRFNERRAQYEPWAIVEDRSTAFDWMDVPKPNIAWSDLIIYEMHVRGFSRLPREGERADEAGSFAAVVKRIPYLKMLGVNAVELLPVMEFNETEWSKISPHTAKPLCQYWGYSTVCFFSLMNRYGTNGTTPADVKTQFQTMVRELHRARIEVILDVVYNHTAEMGYDFVGRGFYGMKQLAPTTYYIMKDGGRTFVNQSGCGNTLNCNNPIVQNLICDSLLYWAHEMGVDGFRFDLASVLCRDTNGELLADPPVIQRFTKHPSMRDVKLIAEPWDCGGAYQVGSFPHHGVWAEWNGKFRDCVRRFFRGDGGSVGELASRLCGSQDVYGASGRAPFHSINFVCAHDGFSLRDVVSYQHKHNGANGEHNNDGEQHNHSWNCGVEGDTDDAAINTLRERHASNMMLALMLAAGTPMLRMGDELYHTQGGNNNAWCQDSALSYLPVPDAAAPCALLLTTRALTALRQREPLLRRRHFLSAADVSWHGERDGAPDWHAAHNVLALSLRARDGGVRVFAAFNGSARHALLRTPRRHMTRLLDTQLPSPQHVTRAPVAPASDYSLAPHSALLLLLRAE